MRPALARGAWVVSDRHVPSTLVYQGVGRGLGRGRARAAERVGDGGPDARTWSSCSTSPTTSRPRVGRSSDRMEREAESFHAEVRAAYRALAAERGWCVVDGSGDADTVEGRVVEPSSRSASTP